MVDAFTRSSWFSGLETETYGRPLPRTSRVMTKKCGEHQILDGTDFSIEPSAENTGGE